MEIFTYEGNKLAIIKKDDDVWFRGKTVADILGYEDTKKAIFKHVDSEDKCSLKRLKSKGGDSSPLTEVGENDQKSKSNDSLPLTRNTGNTIYINESGLYSLILRSKMDKAKEFKRWVTKEVLPSIRKTGKYEFNNRPHKMLANASIQYQYRI